MHIPLAPDVRYFPNTEVSAVSEDAPETEIEVLRRGEVILADRLPAGWSVRSVPVGPDDRRDALLEVRAPDGASVTLVLEAKRVVEGRDVAALRNQLDAYVSDVPGGQGVIVARYLSPPVQARLREAGLSYVDATGNIRVEVPSPGLYLSDRGADKDPWRGPGRPRGTLKGAPAAKVVRAVVDIAGSWTVRQLVDVAKVSTGAAYRVVEFLEREGLATRERPGEIVVSDWSRLLRRWSDDFGFVRNSQVTRWIAPRGLPDLIERAGGGDRVPRYAFTGTIAAAEWAAYAPTRAALVYASEPQAAAQTWDLRPADVGANVVLAEPEFDVVFERSLTTQTGLQIAAPSQVVVDLMTGPGRSPSEAEELLDWMIRNEASWRG